VFERYLDEENISWEAISPFGSNQFIKILSLILLGDWVSFYLSMLNNVDPTPVEKIKWFKSQIY